MKGRLPVFLLLLLGLGLRLGGQTVPEVSVSATPIASDTGSYVLGPEDLIQVGIFGAPNLGTTARVSSSGEIVLPLIGSLAVGGRTVSEAAALVAARYQQDGLLVDPHVTIFLREYKSQKATVTGAVKTPTVVPMLAPMPLGEVLAAAGGVDPLYAGTQADILRGPAALHQGLSPSESLDLRSPHTAGVTIYPGDVVRVPEAGVVYVIGAVKKAGGFALTANDRLTVLQALSLAEGFDTAASPQQAVILRRQADSAEKQIPVALNDVLAHKAPNVALLPNDILYVPRSGAKMLAQRSAEALVNIASGLLIYRRF